MLLSDGGMRALTNADYVRRSWQLINDFHTMSEKNKKSKNAQKMDETFRIGLQSSLSQLLTNLLKADPKHKGAKKLKSEMYVTCIIVMFFF